MPADVKITFNHKRKKKHCSAYIFICVHISATIQYSIHDQHLKFLTLFMKTNLDLQFRLLDSDT